MGFNPRKLQKGVNKALTDVEEKSKARVTDYRGSASEELANVRKDMSDNTAARVAKRSAARSASVGADTAKPQSFGAAFRAARAEAIKAGRDPDKEIFTWGGQKKVAKMASSAPRSGTGTNQKASPPPAVKRGNPPAKADTPAKPSNLEEIKRKGTALRASFTGPPSTPASKKTYDDGQTGNPFGKGRTAQQQTNINAAKARAKSYFEQGKANTARAQSMSESDKVKARMHELGIPGYRKGGSVDGCAVRGKTRAPLRGKKR